MCRKRLLLPAALSCIVAVGTVQADVRFKTVTYPIAGWPELFTPTAWTFTRSALTEKTPRLIIAGVGGHPSACKLLAVDLGLEGGKITGEILRLPREQCPTQLASVDLRGDGVDELVLGGAEPAMQRMLAPVGAKYKEVDLPFPRLKGLVAVWLGQPGGGPDLFLTGLVPIEGRQAAFRRVPGRLYRNQDGKLVPTDQVVEGNPHVLVRDGVGRRSVQPHLLLRRADVQPRHIGWDDNQPKRPRSSSRINPDQRNDVFGDRSVGAPHLRPIDLPFAAGPLGLRSHPALQV